MIAKTVHLYFSKQIIKSLIITIVSFYTLLIVLNITDLNARIEATNSAVMIMSINKSIPTLFELMPMITLMAFMFSFNRMNQNNEITIANSSGMSMYQIFTPAIVIGAIIGVICTTILQPLAIKGKQTYDKLWDESSNLKYTTVKVSETGLWLRETGEANKYRIINAERINENNFNLYNNEIITFDPSNNNIIVYRSDELMLVDNNWVMKNVTKFQNGTKQTFDTLQLPTETTVEDIKKLFRNVDTIIFWDLPNYIRQLRKSELNTSEAIVKFNFLLSMPVLFIAIVFMAGFFSAQPTVRNSNKKNIRNGIIAGFGLYFYINSAKFLVFITDINSHILGWVPTITMLFISIFLLFSADKMSK